MNILGIGPLEILIILVIVLLVLGPENLQETGRTVGKWINKVTRSEGWMAITSISKEIRGLPSRLAREAQLEDLKAQIDIEKQIGTKPETTTEAKSQPIPTSGSTEAQPAAESSPAPLSEEEKSE